MPIIDSVDMGRLTDFLMVITNGSNDANWQGASKGYVGNVAVNGLVAAERTSGFVPYAGTIFTNAATCGAWQAIVNANPGQASCSTDQTVLLADLQANLASAFAQINALPVTPGFESRTPQSLDGLNTQNGVCETIVINLTSGFQVSTQINITGDACDVFILRWDEDANPANGYQGTVKFQSGGAIVPHGGLIPSNFINVAGVIQSSGGGTTPPPPYPQGPRFDDGLGPLINGGADFTGGGFFTGYWLTTGDPVTGVNGSMSNGIFVGGWYTSNTSFSLTSGTSGVYVAPNPSTVTGPCISLQKLISTTGPAGPFVPSPTLPGVIVPSGVQPFFQFIITNCGSVTLTGVTLVDNVLPSPIILPVTELAAGATISVIVPGTFLAGPNCNTGTTTGTFTSETGTIEVTSTATACFTGAVAPAVMLQKLISVDCGVTFQPAAVAPFPVIFQGSCPPQYEFRVTNTGNEALTNLLVNDVTLGIVNLAIPNLPIGNSFTTAPIVGTFHLGEFCNTATLTGTGATSGTPVTAASTACFVGEVGPAINLVKEVSVNCGATFQPASVAPFPELVQGICPPQFRFVITNTGSVTLNQFTLSETSGLPIPALPTTLAPGASFTTTPVTGTFALGQTCNSATVTAVPTTGGSVTSTSTACFVGVAPAISLVKEISVNCGATFQPASVAPFPVAFPGCPPQFRFVITNTGAVTLNTFALTESSGLPIPPLPTTLAPGASFTTTPVTGTFALGTNCNSATVTAVPTTGGTVTATSTACFVGETGPAISLVKEVSVNCGATFQPASVEPFPTLVQGTCPPQFRFVITNIGSVALNNITLTETTGLPIPTLPTTLAPGETFTTLPVTGTFALGTNCNSATVTGTPTTGIAVTATSTACFVGVPVPTLTFVKEISVSGPTGPFVPASVAPFPTLPAGTTPFFRFVVTNPTAFPATLVTITDNVLGNITLGGTILPGQTAVFGPVAGTFATGQHCNTATLTGTILTQPITQTSTACFVGQVTPCITIVKEISVSGAGGPFVSEPAPPACPTLTSPAVPFFRFVVTNSCPVTVTGLTVVDTVLGPITLPQTTLAPGQSFTTTPVQGVFAAGQHTNTATVTGTAEGQTVTHTSTACFVGVVPGPSILVRKLVSVTCGCNFVESPNLPGPQLIPPNRPKFLIIVTNNGTVPLTNITVVDTMFGPITIPTTTLAPGQSFQVKFQGCFVQGPFCNTVTATGVGNGQTVTSTATACFTGGVVSPVPVFPDISGPAPQNQIIDRLLETVALEELALSALINAEAEKIQAVSAAGVMGPVEPSDLEAINNAVANVIAQAAEKERRLLMKLNRILAHKEQQACDP